MHPRRALGLVASLAMLLTACVPSSQSRAELPPTGPRAAQPAATDTQPAPAATAEVVETPAARVALQEYPVPAGSHPHDVAPAPDGGVWHTAQSAGKLGRLDPTSGAIDEMALGTGSAPHGVIVGPDGAPWITDGGLNAIVRVEPTTDEVKRFPLPGRNANLNTATFDKNGVLWFTGQNGVYGRLDPVQGRVEVWDAPRGPGAYGISTTPGGEVYFASLASSYVGRIDLETRK